MIRIFAIITAVLVSGCASIIDQIPSFNDVNQSRAIVQVRASADAIDCTRPQLPQVEAVRRDLRWFRLYSESKPRQADVLRLITPIEATVNDFHKRVSQPSHVDNPAYCTLKKQILQQQTKRAAEVVIGRF